MKKVDFDIDLFFSRLLERFENPKCELDYKNHYTLLVAIVLSAQATDKGVNKATKDLFEKVQTPQQMLDLGEDGLKSYVKSINYYNTKSRHIMEMTKVLVDKFDGKVPTDFDVLQTLPGAVDTHVFRVSNRLGFAVGKTPIEVENKLQKVVPDAYKTVAQHLMVLFGRYICKATKPQCQDCPIADFCPVKEKNN